MHNGWAAGGSPGIQTPSSLPVGATPNWEVPCLWVGCTLGLALVAISFRLSMDDPETQTRYHVFWAGMLTAFLPALVVTLSDRPGSRIRRLSLLVVAVTLTTPSLLLRLDGPLYHDEFPHWREVQAILETGRAFQPVSIVPVLADFPGLHALAAVFVLVSGAGGWLVCVVVLVIAHLLTLLGVFVLGERLSGSERVGGVTAVVYALNPSYLYFDSQFAYESLAICFFVWALVFLADIAGPSPWRPALAAVMVALATVATHHLSTLALLAMMLLLTLARTIAWRRGQSRSVAAATAVVTLATATAALFWVLVVARGTLTYLAPYPKSAVEQLYSIANGSGRSRTLYAGTTVPSYEQVAAFAAPVLVGAAAVLAWWDAWRCRALTATATALNVFGMLYFVSIPLILTSAGAEGARRTWAFSFIGLAVLTAPWLAGVVDRLGSPVGRLSSWAGVLAATVVVLIGNVSAGLNPHYRFPGPATYGVETRTTTAESIALARWLRNTAGPNARVVSDRLTGLALTSVGAADLAVGSAGFPVWQLYIGRSAPPAALVQQLRTSRYQYLVIDRRLATSLIEVSYFNISEPDWKSRPPFTAADLNKFDTFPWTPKVYGSTHFAVYQFDFSALPPELKEGGT